MTDHSTPSRTWVLASNNSGKIREFNALLGPEGITLCPQGEFAVEAAEETAYTFVENALLKARHASRATGLPALADDSGLAVDLLGGAPGVYSARYAGAHASDADNNAKLLAALAGQPAARRSAAFHCVLVFLDHADSPTPVICHGVWPGQVLEQAQGNQGFGYDPLFLVPERGCSAAELSAEDKNRLSHRGRALRSLMATLREHRIL